MRKRIFVILLVLTAQGWAQAPTTCVVWDTLYNWDGTILKNEPVTVVEVVKNGVLVPQYKNRVFKTDGTTGKVSFILPRLSQAKIRVNATGFDGTQYLEIPNADSVQLRDLQVAVAVAAVGTNFMRVQEADGSPNVAVAVGDTISINGGTVIKSGEKITVEITGGGGGSGDITDVGPAYSTGAAFTDGLASTGSTLFVFEGTSVDANELSILSPTANPASDINLTLPSATSTLVGHSTSVLSLTGTGMTVIGTTLNFDVATNLNLTGKYDFTGAEILGAPAMRFEGATDDNIYAIFAFTDPTTSSKTFTFPNASGEVSLLGQTIESSEITNGTILDTDINTSAAIAESKLAFATNDGSRHDHVVADLTNVNGGTDLTADLEEEAHASEHQNGGADEISVAGLSGLLADAQSVTVRKNSGADVGTRARLNFIESANVTLTITDDGAGGEVDVTIAASGGGGSLTVEEADDNPSAVATVVQFDQADGFTVTDEGSGQVQIDFVPPSTFTLDSEWDTPGEVETIWSANILLETEIDGSSELATLMDDETGTAGALVFSVSPAFTGAPTFGNGATSSGTPRILEDSDEGSNYVEFSVPALAANRAVTFPDAAGEVSLLGQEIALTTETSGNYVASVATTAPLAGGAAGSEGAALTLSITADGITAAQIDETGNYIWTGTQDFNTSITVSNLTVDGTSGNLTLLDASGNSPKLVISPGSGTIWNIYVEDTGDDLQLESISASTETVDIANAGAGVADLVVEGTITGSNLSGTNTGDVTLAGAPDYITISGQVITRTKLDLADDLNTFSSANLATNLTDETGTGLSVFSISPAMTGAPTFGNGATSGGTLRILEDTDLGSNYAEFTVPSLAVNTVYTLPPDDGDAGEQLQTDGTGVLTWEAAGAGGSGAFSDVGDPIVQNTITKDVHIGDGAGTLTGKLEIGGDADQPQVVIEGFSTQTDDILIIQNDADTELMSVSPTGLILTAVGLDAIGAVDMDYGSADVTDHTFITDGTGDAEIVLPTGSISGTEILDNTINASDIDETASYFWSTGTQTFANGVVMSDANGPGITVQNTTDASSVQAARFLGSPRATPADNDFVHNSFYAEDEVQSQTEIVRSGAVITDITIGTEDGKARIDALQGGSFVTMFEAGFTAAGVTDYKLNQLTSNGFVKTSGGNGALSIDTNTYLTGNQTVTLSGDVSGSGATAITTTIGADKILESMLKAVNAAVDEDILTFELTTGDFEWHTPTELGLALGATTITVAGTANEITSSAGAQDLSTNRTWTLSLPTALTLTGKTVTGGTINATTLTGAAGGVTLDASGFNGNLTTSDDTFQEVAQKLDDLSTGGATAWQNIGDAASAGSVDFAGFDQDIVSAEDGGDILTITNSDADRATDSKILVLADNDGLDVNAIYLEAIADADGAPVSDFKIAQGASAIELSTGRGRINLSATGSGAQPFFSMSDDNAGFGTSAATGLNETIVARETGATTNAANDVLGLQYNSTGTPAAGLGPGIAFYPELSDNSLGKVASIAGVATAITAGAETGQIIFSTKTAGGAMTDRMFFDSNGLQLGTTGVLISQDGDGAITFLSKGNGSGGVEDLTLNLDDVSNTITATSSTGVTSLIFSGIGLTAAGADLSGGATIIPNAATDVALATAGSIHINTTDEQFSFHSAADGEISGEVSMSAIFTKSWSFDPDAVCDGAVDRLFLMYVGDEAPEGIIIDEWKASFEADPTTEADLDLKYADAFIGVANTVLIDVLDTTTGAATEDTDANINSGNAIPNGKVMYLEFGTAYTESNHQIIFQMWYHYEED